MTGVKDVVRKTALFLVLVLTLLSFSSCFASDGSTYAEEGLENWYPAISSLSVCHFFDKPFLTDYPYRDGDFHYSCIEGAHFSFTIDKALLWLTYEDEDVYQNAKQSQFETRFAEWPPFDGTEAFGFTFYVTKDFTYKGKTEFPKHFIAFGYHDESRTLVFLGFYCSGKDETTFVGYAETDFPAFLLHFYSEWFDWESHE